MTNSPSPAAQSEPLVFFGTEAHSALVFEHLLKAGYNFKLAVTKPDSPRGRGRTLTPPRVKEVASAHGVPVIQPDKLSESLDTIRDIHARYAVLVSFGKIIPSSILEIFSNGLPMSEPAVNPETKSEVQGQGPEAVSGVTIGASHLLTGGIINLHPSLLPLYRGPSPIETALLHGDEETGVSIMRLETAMDAGPVYLQETISLTRHESRAYLYDTLFTRGAELLAQHLPEIFSGQLQPAPQHESEATYCSLLKKEDSQINWQLPAEQIERVIRAHLGWPGSRTTLHSRDVVITKAKLTDTSGIAPGATSISDGRLLVGTSSSALEISSLKPAGKPEMPASDFLRGLK